MSEHTGDAARVAREAKARAEIARLAAVGKVRKHMVRRSAQDGAFAVRKAIGKSGQIVVPIDVIQRWADGSAQEVAVLLLDLDWGLLVIPEFEATAFVADLGIGHSDLVRRRHSNG